MFWVCWEYTVASRHPVGFVNISRATEQYEWVSMLFSVLPFAYSYTRLSTKATRYSFLLWFFLCHWVNVQRSVAMHQQSRWSMDVNNIVTCRALDRPDVGILKAPTKEHKKVVRPLRVGERWLLPFETYGRENWKKFVAYQFTNLLHWWKKCFIVSHVFLLSFLDITLPGQRTLLRASEAVRK